MTGVRPIIHVETSVTAFIGRAGSGPVADPVALVNMSGFDGTFAGTGENTILRDAVADFYFNGGGHALVVRTAEPAEDGDNPMWGALDALERAAGFNLLCLLPETASGDVDAATMVRAAALCERSRAMLLLDAPAAWSASNPVAAAASTLATGSTTCLPASSNAAVFFPRLGRIGRIIENAEAPSTACGAVAGIIARTDAAQGVWRSPAGVSSDLRGGLTLCVLITSADGDRLNRLGVNCIRQFQFGPYLWGARTLRGADGLGDEFKYISVRRTALHIEQCIARGLDWVALEPNDEQTWSIVRASVEQFMHGMFLRGAFQGVSAREAWFVRCDATTTSQHDLDSGRMTVLVGFAPLKPSEFVVVSITVMAMLRES